VFKTIERLRQLTGPVIRRWQFTVPKQWSTPSFHVALTTATLCQLLSLTACFVDHGRCRMLLACMSLVHVPRESAAMVAVSPAHSIQAGNI